MNVKHEITRIALPCCYSIRENYVEATNQAKSASSQFAGLKNESIGVKSESHSERVRVWRGLL